MIPNYISQLQGLLDNQNYPITYRDADYNIIYANKAASDMYSISPESLPVKCYRALHKLESLPAQCYCGYGSLNIKVTEVIEPSINSIIKRVYLPISSDGENLTGCFDIFSTVGTLDKRDNGFTDNQPFVIEETTGTDWQKAPGLGKLTGKERETLLWIKKGKSPAAISKLMQISGNTVNFHMKNIFNKMGADNRAHAVALAYEMDMAKKESIIQEMEHRVKNNFAVLSSIISLRSFTIKDEAALKSLRSIDNLIRGFVSFQTLLLNSDDSNYISVRAFAEQILKNTRNSLVDMPDNIEIASDVDDVMLNMNTAIPCMQIVNEMLFNAIEHAFAKGESGRITLNISRKSASKKNQVISISVKDNGVGLRNDFDINKCDSLGMKILQALTNQIEGKLEVNNDKGAEFKITFTQQFPI